MNVTKKLTVQVSKTANGQYDYLQILSGDQFGLNIVLIADEIVVNDQRPVAPRVQPDEFCECGRRPHECATFDGAEDHGDR